MAKSKQDLNNEYGKVAEPKEISDTDMVKVAFNIERGSNKSLNHFSRSLGIHRDDLLYAMVHYLLDNSDTIGLELAMKAHEAHLSRIRLLYDSDNHGVDGIAGNTVSENIDI